MRKEAKRGKQKRNAFTEATLLHLTRRIAKVRSTTKMSVLFTEDTNGASVLSTREVRTGVAAAMAVDTAEDKVVGFPPVEEDVDRITILLHSQDAVRLEDEAMEVDASNTDEVTITEVVAAIILEEKRTITMDTNERNSLEIVMVGRNLITTITDLTEVTGVPEAAPIHMSLPLNMFLGTITNGESHKESSV